MARSARMWLSPRQWMYLTARSCLTPFRFRIANALARFYPQADYADDFPTHASELAKLGYTELGCLATPEQVAEMRGYLLQQPFFHPYKKGIALGKFPALKPPPGISVAYCDPVRTLHCPHIFDIVNSPKVLSIVGRELGCKPTLSVLFCTLSYADQKAEYDQLFHRDADDWNFVKLFLYLDDILSLEDGPHVFVAGSHLVPQCMKTDTLFKNEEIADIFGPGNIRELYGPAGTALLANTFGVHKGEPPRRKNRMILQVAYSMNPYRFVPRPRIKKEELATARPLDPYVNRLYFN